ncbi:MAG: HGxxPAAW family protein [Sporichthyaceae bacterium]
MSWIAVAIICIGFSIGGLGLCLDPTWWLFWTGVGVTAVGSVMAFGVNIMADYTTDGH